MKNFKPLSKQEHDLVWTKFNKLFQFRPSTTVFPGIASPSEQLVLDVSDCFSTNFPFTKLEDWALQLLTLISKPGDRMYALDWQHECYDFDPRTAMDRDEFDEWMVPVFPNGDYYIFLTRDFKNVWFGHPWEETITLLGEEIVQHAQTMLPEFEKLKAAMKNDK